MTNYFYLRHLVKRRHLFFNLINIFNVYICMYTYILLLICYICTSKLACAYEHTYLHLSKIQAAVSQSVNIYTLIKVPK